MASLRNKYLVAIEKEIYICRLFIFVTYNFRQSYVKRNRTFLRIMKLE
jgi:hypothetical protein